MFTGIIEAVGELAAITWQGSDARLHIRSRQLDLNDVRLGDSIAVNGVCLTVVTLHADGFIADASRETLTLTTLGRLPLQSPLNLEKALTPTTRLGGHLVSGHVDGIAKIRSRKDDGRSLHLELEAPPALAHYIAPKGSVCLDGTSLTVNRVNAHYFTVNIVPHTQTGTIIPGYRIGTEVNLEVDLIARYLERLLQGQQPAPHKDISTAFLAAHGFFKT
ncbi:riboflavin synthase [Thiorhodospira sibirica]|uniref:riboflavin synthase n=1 Tax=Thiorhodospira sibirica TaxID=154347 RepID=UPI00022C2DCD|nr:riboflavin synthase [Thiorhodospira sibirica]